MPSLGPLELVVVMVVALLVFGPKRLPEVGRQVGRGLRELRKLQDTIRDEMNDIMHTDDTPPTMIPTTPIGSAPTSAELTAGSVDPRPAPGVPAPSKFRAPRA